MQTNIQYRADGQITARDFASGLDETRSYDPAGRFTHQTIDTTNVTYSHDAAGNLTKLNTNGFISNYGYDALHRLTTSDYPASAVSNSFTYDSNGNRQTAIQNGPQVTYHYLANSNRLEQTGGAPTVLDSAGNTLAIPGFNFGYNQQGRLQFSVNQQSGVQSHAYKNNRARQ